MHVRICLRVVLGLSLLYSGVAVEFYVAPDGLDSNAGDKGHPFATLERARDEIRRYRRNNQPPVGGATVWLRGGDYFRDSALDLTAVDSGTKDFPIVWRAVEGDRVRLLGAASLRGLTRVTDEKVLNRLDRSAREHVVEFDLRASGITNFGQMKSRGFSRPAAPAHCELFFAGKPMVLARWPNEGNFEKIAGFPDASGHKDEHGGQLGKLEDGFLYAGDRPRAWKDLSEIWVHGYWAWDWANSYERVASIDIEKRLIRTAAPYGVYGFRKGQRFYFLNILEELDQPGEWFLDLQTGMLYFWPPDVDWTFPERKNSPGSMKEPEALFSVSDQPLLRLNGSSYVCFRQLILEGTRANAVEILGGVSNRIERCSIRNVGDSGVRVVGGTGHGVVGCDLVDTGDGGVSLSGGDRGTLTPGAHFVENCHFIRQGRWSKCYVPAVQLDGVGMRVSHNLIQDHPHCAILFNGNDHLIEYNEIHHIALETGDVGAIYTGRDYTYRGNRIRYNFIHHTGGVGMGSMGIYMDDCVSGTEIFGNVFYKVQRATFLGGGRDHRVINNIFVECNHAVELDGRGLDRSPVWRGMVDDTMRKRLAEVPLDLYRQKYPALKTLDQYYGPPRGPALEGDAFKGVPPEGNVVARNVCVGKWLNIYWHASYEMLRLENNVTNAETSFIRSPDININASDFQLKADSPAWKLGFERIPLQEIGLRRDRWQTSSELPAPQGESNPAHRAPYAEKVRPWPGGVIPYDIGNLAEEQKVQVRQAMKRWTDTGAQIQFIPRTSETEYVNFTGKTDAGNNTSHTGFKQGARTDINITAFWWRQGEWMPAHELGHVLGLFHEQQRWDRDRYVTIHYENIKPGRESDYDWIPRSNWIVDTDTYDYYSIMHYRVCWSGRCEAECKDGDGSSPCAVIDPIGTQFDRVIGQWTDNGISAGDAEKVRLVYGTNSVAGGPR